MGAADAASGRSPIAAYSLDAGEGETLEDLTGNEHEGAIEGASWTSGKYGSALSFDGENDCVSIPNTEDLQLSEEFTLEAWVRPSAPLNSAPIFFKERKGFYSYSLYLGAFETGRLEGFVANSSPGYSEVESSEALPAKAWSHVALTSDGAHLRLYVNGALIDTSSAREAGESEGPLYLGCFPGAEQFFEGRLDEVRVYDRALDAGEVGADIGTGLETPPSAPVAAYSFDAGEGSTLEDLTGNEHEGTIEGATWTKGKFGSALEFDGEEDCVSVPESAELRFLESEEFTLEAWVKPRGEGIEALVTQEDEANAEEEAPFSYSMLVGGEEGPKGWLRKGGEEGHEGVGGSEPLPENAWSHLAFTDDGNSIHIYVDGQLVGTQSAIPLTSAEGPLTIGCLAAFGNYLKGKIDEVRIYARALGAGEITSDMHTGIQTPQEAPIAAYSLDAGEGETLEDLTGNEHEGAIEGATWTSGKFGKALSFDGENDCVSIANTEDLQLSEEFTLEAWVRPTAGQSFAPIFFKEIESSSFYSYSLFLGVFETGHLEGFVSKEWPEWAEVDSPEALPGKAWSHVAFTSDGAHLRLYVNGELVDTASAGEIGASEGPLYLGCWRENNEHYQGKIDEVRVYDRALDAGEVGADLGTGLETPPSAPVAAYAFDESEGTVAHDFAGGHEGTIEGATWTRGKFGSALEFNSAEEDVVTIPTSPELDLEDFTLEAWVKPSEIHQFEPVIAKTDPEDYGYELMAGGDGEPPLPEGFITEGESADSYAVGEEELPLRAWTHLAVASDGNKLRFYVDGQLVDTRAGDNLIAGGEAPPQIGGNQSFAPAEFFDGKIDEVRIYGRALSEGEIAADTHTGIETPQQGPIAAYSFDAGEGETLEDLTGNEHEGAIEGATWTARGKYGSALEFDGEEDCVSVPESAELQFLENEEFTLESWVRPTGENIEAIVTQEDNASAEWEEPFSYSMLYGGEEEAPKGWLRKGGEGGHIGVSGGEPIPVNAWSHVALVDDGAKLRLYVDGEFRGSLLAVPLTATTGPLRIGCLASYGNYFKGRIDEVRVYDRGLSAEEVRNGMGPLPTAETIEAYGIEPREAVFAANLNPHDEATSYRFEYGPTTSYGSTAPENLWESEETASGSEMGEVEQAVDNLEPETTYHYRIVATNDGGTVVGHDHQFKTPETTVSLIQIDEEQEALLKKSWTGRININWNGDLKATSHEPEKGFSVMDRVSQSNAKMLRVVIGSPSERGVEAGTYDRIFQHAAEHGITILPNIVGVPAPQGRENLIPPDGKRSLWKEKLEDIIHRWGHGGSFWASHPKLPEFVPEYWEIWNEENYGENGSLKRQVNPKLYGDLLEESNNVITGIDPGAKILFGGVLSVARNPSSVSHKPAAAFIKAVGHIGDYDALSLHPYAFKGSVNQVAHTIKRNIQAARAALNSLGAKGKNTPIWITEIGWPVEGHCAEEDHHHLLVKEPTQVSLLNQTFKVMKQHSGTGQQGFDIANIFYYNVEDWIKNNPHPCNWAYHSGLREEAHGGEHDSAREAWSAFQAQAE